MTSGVFFRATPDLERVARALSVLARTPSRRSVHLWIAGCGSGEDAWSLAMLVDEAELPPHLAVRIVASDADPARLAHAGEAVYRDAQLVGVAAGRRRRHFVRGVGPRDGLWRVIAPLRDRVELIELDLRGAWPALGSFDIVWAHGAFDALDPPARAQQLRRFAEVLAPGGVVLGAEPATGDPAAARHPATTRRPMG